MNIKYLAAAFISVTLSSSAATEIYRWKDANGAVHFSDKAPKNKNYKVLEERKAQIINSNNEKTEAAPEDKILTKTKAASKTKKHTQKKQIDIEACADLKIELATVQRTEAVFKDETNRFHTHRSTFSLFYQGNRNYIDDQQRDKVIQQFENKFSAHCVDTKAIEENISKAIRRQIRARNCKILQLYYNDRQRPKYRSAASDLRRLKDNIFHYCAESAENPSENKAFNELESANLLDFIENRRTRKTDASSSSQSTPTPN
ncbi:MAG TPA: hypothetical protein DD827_08100 [Gammaproteobacteria bacterium]|jgi:hypothetical protein|nr:hypothetical protein [Gammaproteobacteria bacterium]